MNASPVSGFRPEMICSMEMSEKVVLESGIKPNWLGSIHEYQGFEGSVDDIPLRVFRQCRR